MFGNQFEKICAEIRSGHIPAKKHLKLKSKEGVPVAHVLVKEIRMAANWAGWTIADDEGWSAAHVAANENMLPPDFNLWDIQDKEGTSVKDIWREVRNIKTDLFLFEPDDFPSEIQEHRPIEIPADRPKRGIDFWLTQVQDILSRPSRQKTA